jgi:hypothetical protein
MPLPESLSASTPGIQLLIMAESHAATDPSIVGERIDFTSEGSNQDLLNCFNIGHLNLVHCLSYGEGWLLPEKEIGYLNSTSKRGIATGTKQFWRALAALSGEFDFNNDSTTKKAKLTEKDPLGNEDETLASFNSKFAHFEAQQKRDILSGERRLAAKANIIQALRKRGILLVDVSPVPIYAGGGTETIINKTTGKPYTTKKNKLPMETYNKIIRAAWNNYAKYLLQRYRPKNVLLFGLNLEKAIGRPVIQKEIEAVNGTYLGARQHPSYNCIQGRKFIPSLRQFRDLGKLVAESDKPLNRECKS